MEKPIMASKITPKTRKDARDDRLAAELRANLKRRKAAARGRDAPPDAPELPSIPPSGTEREPQKV